MMKMDVQVLIQGAIHAFQYHLYDHAQRLLARKVRDISILRAETKSRQGAEGSLYISQVYYKADGHDFELSMAMKFPHDADSVRREMMHSLLLDQRLSPYPKLATPHLLFASTKDPPIIVYEGVPGTNYDELPRAPEKSFLAGQLLAAIHGNDFAKLNTDLQKDLMRYLAIKGETVMPGFEREFLKRCSRFATSFGKNHESSLIFGDFHQSNVMLVKRNDQYVQAFVIDPHYVQVAGFSRGEDIGTFFGQQAFQEWATTRRIRLTFADFVEFMNGYKSFLDFINAPSLKKIFSHGFTIDYFVAQWAVMDALDIITNENRFTVLEAKFEAKNRLEFALDILANAPFSQLDLNSE